MPKPPATWKSIERAAAKYFGIERTHWAPDDCRGDGLSLEVKHGKQIPKFITKTWQQCLDNCPRGHLPIVVLHPERWLYKDMLVVMRMEDVLDLMGKKAEEDNGRDT